MADIKFEDSTVLTGTGLISIGAQRAGSSTAYKWVHNLSATTDPGVGDDSADGFTKGSLWFRTDTGVVFICRDNAVGAAVWCKLAPSSGPGYVSGRWYVAPGFVISSGGNVNGTVQCVRFKVNERVTIQGAGTRVGTTGEAAKNAQCAIYADNPATARPTGSVLASTGNLSLAAGSTVVTAALSGNITLEPDRWYWFCRNQDSNTATLNSTLSGPCAWSMGSATASEVLSSSSAMCSGVTTPLTFGTWSDLTSATFTVVGANQGPPPLFQVA